MTSREHSLSPGTVLENFQIEKALGGGGFSIVYLARELGTGLKVVIKEYLPSRLARRNADHSITALSPEKFNAFKKGRMMFFQEACTLATLRHENIVNVRNFFRMHNTVYLVMYYEEGQNLQQYILKHKGQLSERFLLTVFPPLLDALQMIHQDGYLHLDIKPGNIHLRPGGRPLLLDFGAVHQRQHSRQDQIGNVTSMGYSPIEQYNRKGYMGPWTDIYAIGATMRSCIEGKAPPPAVERYENDTMKPATSAFRKQYSAPLLEALDWALEVDPELRPQNIMEFREALPALDIPSKSLGQRLIKKITGNSARKRKA
jgi:serine/threonine protein kinase